MRRYISYFKYVLNHKKHVAEGCRKVGLSRLRAFVHDWDKFLPSMFIAYARFFYNPDGTKRSDPTDEERSNFMKAFRGHYERNKHHWNHWCDYDGENFTNPRKMDVESMVEMIADWYGAGIAITGKEDVHGWYHKQLREGRIVLHPDTEQYVTSFIEFKFPPKE